MNRLALFILLAFLSQPLCLFAQFTDDFSDGDFTSNPTWIGETEKFRITNDETKLLQLFEENFTGSAYLATPSQAVLDASWEFFMKFEFNPSSANYTDVYVMADRANLSENLNGYFLRVGSTKDDICLYKKTGATSTKIIEGIEKRLDSDPVNLRIKLTRDYEGNWSLFSDTLGGFNYILEGTVLDNTHTESAFFGVYCKYSTTRKDKIFFDDFVVTGDFIVDEEAPVLESATAISENTLLLSFNEALSSNVLSATNFTVNQSLGNPAFVEFADASQAALELKFSSNFVSAQEYQLEYKNIEDLSGNITPTSSVSFMYIDIVPNIIVINEIMADPNPPVGLPEAEYIELFNTSAASIDLSDWKLVVGNYVRPIPSVSIEGNGYLVLCNPNNVDLFEVSIPILGVPSFPAIPNNGSTLKLLTDEDVEINSVSYDLSWYGDSQKANGGWALELIDPFNQCSAYGNWTASNNPNGGTPGYINSVFAENPDTIPPELVSVQVVDANQIIVNFNEFVDTISALNTANYHISPEFGNPDIALLQEDRKSVSLFMPWAFTQDELYTLKVSNLEDMCGNVAENQEISFSLHLPEMYDLLITEIMADPDPPVALPNAEYVEIYNRSDFPFDLSDWKLQVNKSSCSLNGITIQPNEYITICNINNLHLFQDIEKVYGVASFPALPNAGATISLISPEQEYIHALAYSDTWYRSNFKKSGGWSLEMIDTNNPCEGANNWKASENQNGGTPSKLNSVKAENPDFTRPDIIHAEIVNADTVRVFFNETMRISSLEPSQNYWLDWNIGSPSWAYPEPPLYQSVLLKFDANFEKGKVYTLNFSDTIADCAGNKVMLNYETIIGISDSIQPGDIVINEILFNPFTGGKKFVEFYNKSNKLLDLSQLWFSKRNDLGELDAAKQASELKIFVLPNSYRVVTESPEIIMEHYYVPNPELISLSTALPSLPVKTGNLVVLDRAMNIIDEFVYDESMHFALISTKNGVSLERIDYNRPTQSDDNWHSAASSVGYATPGYENSQYRNLELEIDNTIFADPSTFSPDNDGYNDRLNIHYNFETPGAVVTMAVYDSKGRFITWLCRNESLPANGIIYWDGLDNRNQKCPIGVYVVYVEVFDAQGKSFNKKIPVVLSLKKI